MSSCRYKIVKPVIATRPLNPAPKECAPGLSYVAFRRERGGAARDLRRGGESRWTRADRRGSALSGYGVSE
eukprot:5904009-Prymnesium_polylepis.1